MNLIFLILVLCSAGFAGWRQIFGEHAAGEPLPIEGFAHVTGPEVEIDAGGCGQRQHG